MKNGELRCSKRPPTFVTLPTPAREVDQHLGFWQLWRSLPRPCKLFLAVCVIQAFISGAFAARELSRAGSSSLQDLLLILISAFFFLLLVLDAFWHENGYQLLVAMASGALNLVQLIVYATALKTSHAGAVASLGVVIVCAVLQAMAVALARWAYLGFGWRMYSKIACDATLPDAERRRAIGLRLGRFSAVAKLDIQLLCLLLVVGVVNGANPSKEAPLPPLLAVACVGVTACALWLAICWSAVAFSRPKLGLFAEFTYPVCYIVGAAFMFSSVSYNSRLGQVHGQAYLLVYPVLFVAGQTWVWWDARLLSVSDIAAHHHDDFVNAAAGGKKEGNNNNPVSPRVVAEPQVPSEILPLVHGAWLLKLPSLGGGPEGSPSKRGLRELLAAAGGPSHGKWRYFQLSHDGSTLRWDWRKYVLLVHVESVSCNPEDLTITLSLTLEPDLRLKFPNAELHAAWTRGLTLLVMLLGNPDGLKGRQAQLAAAAAADTSRGRRLSLGSRDVTWGSVSVGGEPCSPRDRTLRSQYSLASASGRASAAGLLTKEALEAAAWQARRALGDCSQPATPSDGKDLERGEGGGGYEEIMMKKEGGDRGYTVISLRAEDAGATPRRPGSAALRQRTPSGVLSAEKRGSGTPPVPPPSDGVKHSPSKSKRRRAEETQSWLRRALTAPVSALAEGVQQAAAAATTTSTQINQTASPPVPQSPFDLEAGPTPPAIVVPLQRWHSIQRQSMGTGVTPPSGLPKHFRSVSLDGQLSLPMPMPSVPEGSGSFNPGPPLPPGVRTQTLGGVYHIVAQGGRYPVRASSASPASTGSPGMNSLPTQFASRSRSRGSSPLKPGAPSPPPGLRDGSAVAAAAAAANVAGGAAAALLRYGSAPMNSLQRSLSGAEGTDSETSVQALPHAASDASWHMQSPGGTLLRYDSLGPSIAPGSKVWQAVFDAGMAAHHQLGAGGTNSSLEGSPSPSATPHSVQSVSRSVVAVNMELIDFEQLAFGRMLGEGAEGPVYAAWYQETPVAVKRASYQSEVDLHLHAGWHDNVVNLRGLAQHGGHTYIVMELCPRGTLDVLIHQGSSASTLRTDPSKLLPIVRSIARGMLHLHTRSPPILHRDLKPANIFIGHGYVMKIGDFGMARYAADTRAHRAAMAHIDPGKFGTGKGLLRTLTPGVIGTAAYCAPELLHPETPKAAALEEFNEDRLLKADVYSFGVLLWELLERRRPYADMDGFQIQTQWVLDPGSMRLKPPKVPDSLKSPASRRVMQTLSDLVAACTAWDPVDRPSFREILSALRGASQDADGPPSPRVSLASPF